MREIKLKVENPRQVEYTLTLTMPLSEWLQLKGQVESAYPGWRLASAIRKVVEHAEQVATAEVEVET